MSCCFPPRGIQMDPNQQLQADSGVHSLFQNHMGREALESVVLCHPDPNWQSERAVRCASSYIPHPQAGEWGE